MANYIIADDGLGNVQTFLVSDYQLLFPTAIIKTPTANFSFSWNNVLTDYLVGSPVVVTADLFTAMTTAGMPIA